VRMFIRDLPPSILRDTTQSRTKDTSAAAKNLYDVAANIPSCAGQHLARVADGVTITSPCRQSRSATAEMSHRQSCPSN